MIMILNLRVGRLASLALALAVGAPRSHAAILFDEDFEDVPLNAVVTFPSETPNREAWSSLAAAQSRGVLTGWQDQKLGVLGTLDPLNSGVQEFFGWTFVGREWWVETSGDQDRSRWSRGYGVVAVADNDEFDDFSFGPAENQGLTNDRCDSVATASPGSGGCYAATIDTPSISIAGQPAGSVRLIFDSSWRPEGEGPFSATATQPASSGTFQTGRVEVSFDNGPFQVLRTYRSDASAGQRTLLTTPADPAGTFYNDLDLVDEVVDIPVDNPAGAASMRVRFNQYDSGNDWWWGVDNVRVYTGSPGLRDPAMKVVVNRDNGVVSIVNGTASTVNLRGYQVTSADGTFSEAAASFRADADANWVQLTKTGSGSDLSEGHLSSASVPSGGSFNLGSAWLPYFDDEDDLGFQYLVTGRVEPVFGLVEVVGGVGGKAFPFLDLNFDGAFNIADWSQFLAITDRADLSSLTVAQAYRKGDLDGDRRLGVNDFIVFQREFDRVYGAGAFAQALSTAIPEPAALALGGFVAVAACSLRRRQRQAAAVLAAALACQAAAQAAVTVDRLYLFGDNPQEGASAGMQVKDVKGVAPGFTLDSAGIPGGQQLVDLAPRLAGSLGSPTYVRITDRPDFAPGQSGLAVQFNGASRNNLQGQRLGTPRTSISSESAGGTLDYEYILDRGLQFWVKPSVVPATNSGLAADDDHIVMDTNNHGALINSFGRFTMRYNGIDYAGSGPAAAAKVNQWQHVMVVRPDGSKNGARMFVNGVAVAAAPGDYLRGIPAGGTPADVPDQAPLVVGGSTLANTALDSFGRGFRNNFSGIVDDLKMFVTGFNQSGELGIFNVGDDNDYIARFGPSNPLDLAGGDGQVNLADVQAFAANWLSIKSINGLTVGDLETVARGDFNYDGRVDLRDWEILNAANPSLASVAMKLISGGSVPEPSAAMLAFAATAAAGCRRKRLA